MLLHNKNGTITQLRKTPFKLEKDLKIFVEDNLETLLNLEVVKSEFSIGGYRFDTLAFDKENMSFVIIEYKRGKNDSVVDQGCAYLKTALEYQAELLVEYSENKGKNLRRSEINWGELRVIFISQDFTKYQKDSIFMDLPIELYKVERYENNIILFKSLNENKVNINPQDKNSITMLPELKELHRCSIEEHLSKCNEEIQEAFELIKVELEELFPELIEKVNKHYISFRLPNKHLIDIKPLKKSLKIFINARKGMLQDPKNLAKDMSQTGHLGNGDYSITISDLDFLRENINYILSLIKDASNFKSISNQPNLN